MDTELKKSAEYEFYLFTVWQKFIAKSILVEICSLKMNDYVVGPWLKYTLLRQ